MAKKEIDPKRSENMKIINLLSQDLFFGRNYNQLKIYEKILACFSLLSIIFYKN